MEFWKRVVYPKNKNYFHDILWVLMTEIYFFLAVFFRLDIVMVDSSYSIELLFWIAPSPLYSIINEDICQLSPNGCYFNILLLYFQLSPLALSPLCCDCVFFNTQCRLVKFSFTDNKDPLILKGFCVYGASICWKLAFINFYQINVCRFSIQPW